MRSPTVVDDCIRQEVLERRPRDRCGRIIRTRQPVGLRHVFDEDRLVGTNRAISYID